MDFFSFVKPKNELESQPNEQQNVPFVPEEMWIKCPKCNSMLLTTDMEENCHICPMCGHHFRINAGKEYKSLQTKTVLSNTMAICSLRIF